MLSPGWVGWEHVAGSVNGRRAVHLALLSDQALEAISEGRNHAFLEKRGYKRIQELPGSALTINSACWDESDTPGELTLRPGRPWPRSTAIEAAGFSGAVGSRPLCLPDLVTHWQFLPFFLFCNLCHFRLHPPPDPPRGLFRFVISLPDKSFYRSRPHSKRTRQWPLPIYRQLRKPLKMDVLTPVL